jgi:hypothetical protein
MNTSTQHRDALRNRWALVAALALWFATLLACAAGQKAPPPVPGAAPGAAPGATPGSAPASAQLCQRDQDCTGDLVCESGRCAQIH